MNAPDHHDWQPDSQVLGAYFDGEMEGRDDLADLRARLEAWLEQHPDARTQWAEHQALMHAWLDTTPQEPDAAIWRKVLDRIDAESRRPAAPTVRRSRRRIGVIAAGIALLVGVAYVAMQDDSSPTVKNETVAVAPPDKALDDDDAVFPVATAGEIVVSYIEGADTHAIAVGQLPVHGPLELAESGDVHVVAIRSDAESRMRPQVRQDGPSRPMVWMPRETD
jgi:anti-sigma factor RsiW